MRVLLDTAVVMYAGGATHLLREPCQEVIRSVVRGGVTGHISAEAIQEILHRFTRGGAPEQGVQMARSALDLLGPPLPLDVAVLERTLDLLGRHDAATARDLVHAATCIVHGLDAIVTPDRDFDAFPEVRRIDPLNWP